MENDRESVDSKKSAALLIDGGYLCKILESLEQRKRDGATDFAPRPTADNIQKIALACINRAEESLLRILFYDCDEYCGYAAMKHPYFDRDCMILPDGDLRERRQRGAGFYVLNPRKGEARGDSEKQLVWRHPGRRANLLNQLEMKDLFAVRRGRLAFAGWEENFSAHEPERKFFPRYTQKGVDIKIGLDIASISLTRQTRRIILLTGDTDFVPAMKFARRHGIQLALVDLPGRSLSSNLRVHCDYLRAVDWPGDLEQYEPHYNRKP